MRIGHGYDVHKLGENRDLIIGGVKIPHHLGLVGHSDADVLVHAIMDSILGALALRDIGYHFPDNDSSFKNINSLILLEKVKELLDSKGYKVGNIDSTIIAQKPKLSPYIETMRENISRVLGVSIDDINVKATTEEKLGFTGEEKGISAHSVCIIFKA
ncbi:2-C-methyl-D-erythritol 2,4-cyclodiphosphate synthase [Clostridium cylindrosporum]|uniref:2-C-methyl-D-erythritol 2,4-cyclodiphosphate synthase n=1 Tax=Clostridium cylindrosporum DSM 605 TaxID=1121307 RepID=A0A0J8G3Z6_CLOCY|nr:2-C-methyl-D-erythritol 2,4-cyclodiphosphate synthase [Clostridium cylindrosporum]KMT22426.1 2-C-methyl-D-erythritol 2,4-cyclodiphosphate synthase IspF [Clostridium cylindrosporum DSM 605]